MNGEPVTLHRLGSEWFLEVDGHPSPLTINVDGCVPEAVFRAIAAQLDEDKTLTWDRVLTQALSMWTLNRGTGGRMINRAYLDATFPYSPGARAA